MTYCAEAACCHDEQRLVEVASIQAAGILPFRIRQSLPVANQAQKRWDSATGCLEFSGETVPSVAQGG